jgi:DNA-binding transcriptional regulator YiaG
LADRRCLRVYRKLFTTIQSLCIVVYMNELKKAARDLTNARARLADAMSAAADVAVSAHAEGMTEVDLAQYLGVNRMTIRKWLGK